MPQYVVDANVLISIMISGKSSYKPILGYFDFYTPDFVFEEIEKYKPVIFEKTKLNKASLFITVAIASKQKSRPKAGLFN